MVRVADTGIGNPGPGAATSNTSSALAREVRRKSPLSTLRSGRERAARHECADRTRDREHATYRPLTRHTAASHHNPPERPIGIR